MSLFIVSILVIIFVMVLSAIISTDLADEHSWISKMVGLAFGAYIIAVPILFVVLLVSRMRLHSAGTTLNASFLIGGFTMFHRSAAGHSWHAVVTPGGNTMDGEGTWSYRVEVANHNGERTRFLGPILCWLYRVECL